MTRYTATEGGSGILTLKGSNGDTSKFIPNYDMDAAIDLLQEFQQLPQLTRNAQHLKDNYYSHNHNWYPTMVSFLFWYFFFPFIKYRPLIESIWHKDSNFHCNNAGAFSALLYNLDMPEKPTFKETLYNTLIHYSNWISVQKRKSADIIFFRFARNDFRTQEIRSSLEKLGSDVLDIGPSPGFATLLKNILASKPELYFRYIPARNDFNYHYDLKNIENWKTRLFSAGVRYLELTITSLINEYKQHSKIFAPLKAQTFYGLDDINAYFFPAFLACKDHGMRTIGHQHGAYVKRHAGYIMKGIRSDEFEWFDKVIVWGNYWKNKILRDSSAHSKDRFVVGSNKFTKRYISDHPVRIPPKSILIPYEFLANTARIGEYICAFQNAGYMVYFKPRSDSPIADQIEAYCLPTEHRLKLNIVTEIDAETFDKIDVIAGTMTTLIYELLPYNKIVWYLDTEYRHLKDIVDEGLGHQISLFEIGNISPEKFKTTLVSQEDFFGFESLEETLLKHVISSATTHS